MKVAVSRGGDRNGEDDGFREATGSRDQLSDVSTPGARRPRRPRSGPDRVLGGDVHLGQGCGARGLVRGTHAILGPQRTPEALLSARQQPRAVGRASTGLSLDGGGLSLGTRLHGPRAQGPELGPCRWEGPRTQRGTSGDLASDEVALATGVFLAELGLGDGAGAPGQGEGTRREGAGQRSSGRRGPGRGLCLPDPQLQKWPAEVGMKELSSLPFKWQPGEQQQRQEAGGA